MFLRTKSSLDVGEEALQEISSEATKLVFEYMTTISERPVRAENHAGKTTQSIDTELSADGLPLTQLLDDCRTIMDLSVTTVIQDSSDTSHHHQRRSAPTAI